MKLSAVETSPQRPVSGAQTVPASKPTLVPTGRATRGFLTPDDITQVKSRYDQQGLDSGWYGFSLVGGAPFHVAAVIAFTSFGDRDHLLIVRLDEDSYAVMADDETVLATADRIDQILDLFDERVLRH
jgi:hypothetical protein